MEDVEEEGRTGSRRCVGMNLVSMYACMLPQRYFITAGFELTEVYIFVCVQNAIHSITAQLRRGELALPAGRSLTRSGSLPSFHASRRIVRSVIISPYPRG